MYLILTRMFLNALYSMEGNGGGLYAIESVGIPQFIFADRRGEWLLFK